MPRAQPPVPHPSSSPLRAQGSALFTASSFLLNAATASVAGIYPYASSGGRLLAGGGAVHLSGDVTTGLHLADGTRFCNNSARPAFPLLVAAAGGAGGLSGAGSMGGALHFGRYVAALALSGGSSLCGNYAQDAGGAVYVAGLGAGKPGLGLLAMSGGSSMAWNRISGGARGGGAIQCDSDVTLISVFDSEITRNVNDRSNGAGGAYVCRARPLPAFVQCTRSQPCACVVLSTQQCSRPGRGCCHLPRKATAGRGARGGGGMSLCALPSPANLGTATLPGSRGLRGACSQASSRITTCSFTSCCLPAWCFALLWAR